MNQATNNEDAIFIAVAAKLRHAAKTQPPVYTRAVDFVTIARCEDLLVITRPCLSHYCFTARFQATTRTVSVLNEHVRDYAYPALSFLENMFLAMTAAEQHVICADLFVDQSERLIISLGTSDDRGAPRRLNELFCA